MAGVNGKDMSMTEFLELLTDIMTYHSWNAILMGKGAGGHMVKYVRPYFDTRIGKFFGLELEGMRGIKSFFVTNENSDKDLTAWVREFLDNPAKEAGWEPWGGKDAEEVRKGVAKKEE